LTKNKKFDLQFYTDNSVILAGVDEAGRGPLAGPVVAAAVIFDKETFIDGVNDSKQLTESQREDLSTKIKKCAFGFGYGIVNEKIIDEINILQASLKAMKIAVKKLSIQPNFIIVDGNKSFLSNIKTMPIVKGDSKSFSIAAASILAKVERDHIMKKVAKKYPQYFWEKNKGYGTSQHIEAIKKYSFTPLHRKTFLTKIVSGEQLFLEYGKK